MSKKKTFWVQLVKTIHVPVVAENEDAAAEEARERDAKHGNTIKWSTADSIVYDVNQEGA